MPALMVTAGKDFVLLPALSKGMEDMVGESSSRTNVRNLKWNKSVWRTFFNQIPNLTRGHIEECGHWTQMDKPAETNDILIGWLKEVHRKAAGVAPKL